MQFFYVYYSWSNLIAQKINQEKICVTLNVSELKHIGFHKYLNDRL